jgi:hypothetical protein
MKHKMIVIAFLAIGLFSLNTSCKKKETCHECHYDDDNGQMVDLGKKCGDDLEKIEAEGVMVNGKKYEVHCHDH